MTNNLTDMTLDDNFYLMTHAPR